MNTMYRVLILFSVYLRVFTVVTAQEACPAGQFRSGEYCEMCPWGKFSEVSGATSAESCLFCEPGQYSDDPGGGAAWTRCLPCPGNSSSDPVRLSQNIVGGETDTRAQTQCACNVGYAQNEEYRNYELSEQLGYRVYNDLCVPCYAGTYQPQSLQFSMRSLAYMQYHWRWQQENLHGLDLASHVRTAQSRLPAAHTVNARKDMRGATTGPAPCAGRGFTRAHRETSQYVMPVLKGLLQSLSPLFGRVRQCRQQKLLLPRPLLPRTLLPRPLLLTRLFLRLLLPQLQHLKPLQTLHLNLLPRSPLRRRCRESLQHQLQSPSIPYHA
jgi:hypothetical protein